MGKKLKVLLTGAHGRVGKTFLEEYEKRYNKNYEIILGVHRKTSKKGKYKQRKIELTNLKTLKKALKGIDVVIHLAANANPNASFKETLNPNIIGTYNLFEAAKQAKCSRVVFASSVHAIQGYGHNHQVKHTENPRPIDLYGASKVYGEALCHVFFSQFGLSCLAIRIGAFTSNDRLRNVCFSRHDYDHIISQRDLSQLIHKCIIAPKKVKYGILSGISNNKKKDMELAFAKKLVGYSPKDNADKLCKSIKKMTK